MPCVCIQCRINSDFDAIDHCHDHVTLNIVTGTVVRAPESPAPNQLPGMSIGHGHEARCVVAPFDSGSAYSLAAARVRSALNQTFGA